MIWVPVWLRPGWRALPGLWSAPAHCTHTGRAAQASAHQAWGPSRGPSLPQGPTRKHHPQGLGFNPWIRAMHAWETRGSHRYLIVLFVVPFLYFPLKVDCLAFVTGRKKYT